MIAAAAKHGYEIVKVGQGSYHILTDGKRLTGQTEDDAARLILAEAKILPAPKSALVARIQSKLDLYPKVIDPRTGRHIGFPSGITGKVDKSLRVPWAKQHRADFIAEWERRGYAEPIGGWDKYGIHYIQPREFGGTNDFWNLVPVERKTHQDLFNEFWREFLEL